MTDARDLPPDVAASVRDYFGALLTAREVEPAMQELGSDVAYWGDDRPVDVFSAARTIVHARIRVADDLEAIVLQEDCHLTVDEIAKVMKRGPAEIRRLLDEAAMTLAEPKAAPDGSPTGAGPRSEPPRSGPDPVARSAPTQPPVPASSPASPPASEDDRTAPPSVGDGPAAGAADPQPDDTAGSGTLAAAAEDDGTVTPRASVRIDADEPPIAEPSRSAAPTSDAGGPRWRTPLLLAAGALVIVVLAIVFRPDGSAPPCPGGAVVCIDEAVMTNAVDTRNQPVESRDTFRTSEDVRIWFRFTRAGTASDPRVEVRWYRGDTLLYGSPFRLPTGDSANVTLAKLFMTEPGEYRVELLSEGEVIAEESFRVVASDDA